MTRILLLFSGGLDSTVLLAHALDGRHEVRCLEIDYPGRSRGERHAADAIRRHYSLDAPLKARMPSPDGTPSARGRVQGHIPLRNLWFHATAALLAHGTGAAEVWAGHTRTDGDEFPDARPEYFTQIQGLLDAGRLPGEAPVRLILPFLERAKDDILALGRHLGAPIDLTWSCYKDADAPCGACTSCFERAAAEASARR